MGSISSGARPRYCCVQCWYFHGRNVRSNGQRDPFSHPPSLHAFVRMRSASCRPMFGHTADFDAKRGGHRKGRSVVVRDPSSGHGFEHCNGSRYCGSVRHLAGLNSQRGRCCAGKGHPQHYAAGLHPECFRHIYGPCRSVAVRHTAGFDTERFRGVRICLCSFGRALRGQRSQSAPS